MSSGRVAHRWSIGYSAVRVCAPVSTASRCGEWEGRSWVRGLLDTLLGPEETGRVSLLVPSLLVRGVSAGRGVFLLECCGPCGLPGGLSGEPGGAACFLRTA